MKKLITLFVAMTFIAGISSLNAQEMITFSDDFSYTLDFMTEDLPDTSIWEAWEVKAGTYEEQNTDLLQLKADGNSLFIESANGSFTCCHHDDGVLLYRTVPDGIDFEAVVHLIDGDFFTFTQDYVYYNMAGIVVRAADYYTRDIITLYFFENYDCHFVWKSMDDEDETTDNEQCSLLASFPDFYQYPWMKLKRVGNTFSAETSQDGITWYATEIESVDRPDLEDVDLHVGLTQCTFTGDTGTALLDDFSLTHENIWASVREIRDNNVRVWSKDHDVVLQSTGNQLIQSARIFSIDGRMIASMDQVMDRRCEFRNLRTGLYIAVAKVRGSEKALKVVVR